MTFILVRQQYKNNGLRAARTSADESFATTVLISTGATMTSLWISAGLLAALLLAVAHSLPPRRSRADPEDFVAVGTNELATTMLQHYADVDANIAISPLGVSALLAILAEGARGETRDQLVATLHLPADREKVRNVYKEILTRLKDKHTLNHPEFRNWFYIYKNYTVEQCFRDVLEENYLTEVRDVDNPNRDQVPVHSPDSTTETIIIHKPVKIENTGVKVELPEITTDQPETTSVENELQNVDVDAAKAEELVKDVVPPKSEYPVKGEGLDPYNLPADLHPMAQYPIILDKDKISVVQPSQEDSIRTIMVQEAVVMGDALKEHDKNKTMEKLEANKTLEYIKEREEEMKETLEKDVVNKEQMKVDIQEQIDTEKELQNALEDKINQQEVIKEVLETNMNKEEEAIDTLKEDIAKLEKEKEETAPVDTGMENMNMNIAVVPDLMNGGQIKVAVVVMNDEEVKQDEAVAVSNKIPAKEEYVDHDKDEKQAGPSVPFKDVSMFDPIYENTDKESTTEKETTGVSFIDVSFTDNPKHPHNHHHTHDHDHKHDHTHSPTETTTTTTTPQDTEEETPDEEMMVLERKARSTDEITSSFSGNSLAARGSAGNTATSMMIAFNALYFKGAWKVPFIPQSKDGVHSFYTSDTEQVPVNMMHAEGSFSIGKIAELDSVAIDLPYEGGRYSLLVLLPNSRTGLKKLTADLAGHSLCELSRTLTPQRVEVCLPSFEVQTTSKPISALSKFGVSHVFNKDNADLSGITPVHGLFVQDMSQLVTLNVDLTSSSTNFLTASNEAAMTRGGGEKFIADRPFLYFVHDVIDNIIVVAGKVTNPNTLPDDFKSEV